MSSKSDTSTDIHPDRVRVLHEPEDHGETPPEGADYVLYVMEGAMRATHNHALEYAVQRANALDLRLLVLYPLVGDTFGAYRRQKHFMLQGVAEIKPALLKRGVRFAVIKGGMAETTRDFANQAGLVVLDRGYLREHKAWRDDVAETVDVAVHEVEGNVVVPVATASEKREHAARTIRKKIMSRLDTFCVGLKATTLKKDSTSLSVDGEIELTEQTLDGVLDGLNLDDSVPPVPLFKGGQAEGRRVFRAFLKEKFSNYSEHRNQPQTSDVSHMSKYLHFGNVSPIWLVREARASGVGGEDLDDFIEELVVRRELPHNFVEYDEHYDSYDGIPEFAKKTLAEHKRDEREHVYTRQQLEDAETHDDYWNAAQRELVHTGYMHNYMRMYWGKKIIEWTNTPQYAFETTLYLNNKYFLDGRDPNSYAGVSWCYGTHDRGWTERAIFGKVRYMNAAGLERKAKPKEYVKKVDALVEAVS